MQEKKAYLFINLFSFLLEEDIYTRKKKTIFFCLLGFLARISPAETLVGFSSRNFLFSPAKQSSLKEKKL